MKTNMNIQKQFLKDNLLRFTILVLTLIPISLTAQPRNTISGEIAGRDNQEQIAFANVALFDSTGTRLIGGVASNAEGMFSMKQVSAGKYKIMVSALGFESFSKPVEMNGEEISLGIIELTEKKLELNDVVVKAERTKAKSEPDKNTFFISQKMQDASNSGTDILNLIPGVSVDIQQNISLEGSRNILIIVDGKERDPGFLRQLQAGQIDKVEIISNPPAQYDASVTGVINIILKKEKKSGLDGHVYAEIPATPSVILLNPAYSLNFGFGKFNLFTSYNGDLRRFNITEFYNRKIVVQTENIEITSTQEVTQKTWSHRFHYGFDWFLNSRNQLNFYGYYNPFSQELDGNVKVETTGTENENWLAFKNDDDTNRSLFYSIWYKHVFDERGHEISLDMSLYNLKAINNTTFTSENNGFLHENLVQPDNHSTYIKLDYTLPFDKLIKLNTGFQTRLRSMRDNNAADFGYDENNYA
ncbi:MAG: TonB-dependent receptor, partial [Bacteroidales bacterium]|nr:TonB-dependent receptor [Bacteroidales bacterium]